MSVLPTKYVPVDHTIIGVGSLLLEELTSNDTVSTLWDRVRSDPRVRTFDRFADALTVLFAGGMLELNAGIIVKPQGSLRTA